MNVINAIVERREGMCYQPYQDNSKMIFCFREIGILPFFDIGMQVGGGRLRFLKDVIFGFVGAQGVSNLSLCDLNSN